MSETHSKSNQPRKALITGATGFVGSHLARRLVQEGWQINILIRENSIHPVTPVFEQASLHYIDGNTESIVGCMEQAKPDVIFHVASHFLAQHESKDVVSLVQSNVLFGNQLLEAMKVNKIKYFINTGTSWQHYNNDKYNPVCLYAASKQAFEAILEYYVQACNIKAITLKLFDTYGPNDPRSKLLHLLNKAAKSGEVLNMSPGEQLIDLVHIDDVIDAYLIAAKRLIEDNVVQHELYAVSSGNPIPLKELVKFYATTTGKNIKVNWGARPYRFREVMNTWNLGVPIQDWGPKISLENGVKGSN
jgi:nucleoside-diphosphate-sugar epimerase